MFSIFTYVAYTVNLGYLWSLQARDAVDSANRGSASIATVDGAPLQPQQAKLQSLTE